MKITSILFFCLLSFQLSAQNLTIDQIVEKANEANRYFGDDVKSTALMDVRDKSGKTIMERELVILRKNTGGLNQKWYAYFKQPADLKKMVFMAWKQDGKKSDKRWLYLPNLDLVKRLSTADKRGSFAGSQFTYEDVTGRRPNEDTHELLETTDVAYQIKSTPKKPASVEFSYFVSWVDKTTFLPTKAILYDKSGDAYKQFDVLESEQIQNFPTMTKFSMTNIKTKESTIITMTNIQYNSGIIERIFSEGSLRRAPRQYLR
ncbi:MAG: outer membrane lipoprotein-sorting protein [Bacteroidota bacterium]